MQWEAEQVTETAQTVALGTLQNSFVIEFKVETWQKWDWLILFLIIRSGSRIQSPDPTTCSIAWGEVNLSHSVPSPLLTSSVQSRKWKRGEKPPGIPTFCVASPHVPSQVWSGPQQTLRVKLSHNEACFKSKHGERLWHYEALKFLESWRPETGWINFP